jgi:hypothetical protein
MEIINPKHRGNQIPFKGDMLESDVSETHKGTGKLKELENNPNKIIRVIDFESLEQKYQGRYSLIELAGFGMKLYKELESNYGISVPVEYVAGKDENGNGVIYGVTDRVAGKDLSEIEATAESAEQVEKLYISISEYYLDKSSKLAQGEMYLSDINDASSYIHGTTANNEKPRIFFVDTDLYFRDDKISFYYVVAWLVRHMRSQENKFNKQFGIARTNIEKILSSPLLDGLQDAEEKEIDKAIAEAKSFLEGKFSDDSDELPTGV